MRLKLWVAMMIVTFMTLTTVAKLVSRPLPEPPIHNGATLFNTGRAMGYLNEIAENYHSRDYTRKNRLNAAEWIGRQWTKLGYQVYTQNYSENIAGKKVTGLRNVYAVLPGLSPEVILVVAHYDITLFDRQGAADDASGMATMLELSRIFAKDAKPQRTIVFLASGSECYGAMWGSVKFLQKSGWRQRIKAVLTLDHVNMGVMKGIQLQYTGTKSGYTPLWYRQLALRAVNREAKAIDSTPLTEWLERSALIAPREPGVYLQEGIPAVNLYGVPRRKSWQQRMIHSPKDTTENIRPGSVGRYGRAAERTLRSLLALNEVPGIGTMYWKTGERFIPERGLILLQLLFLLPLAVGLVEAWKNVGSNGMSGLTKEFSQWMAIVGAGLAGYFVLWLSAGYNLIKTFELHPIASKDPIILHPAWLPLLLAVAAIALAYYVLHIAFKIRIMHGPMVGFAFYMTVLTLTLFISILCGKGFPGLTFMASAVLFWPLIKPSKALSRRIVNFFLSVTVLIVFVWILGSLSHMYDIQNIWWYLIMASLTGLVNLWGVFFFLAGTALLVRVIFLSSSHPETYRSELRIPANRQKSMKF